MLKYVMKVEKEVTEIVFCKDIQALSPTLCAGKPCKKQSIHLYGKNNCIKIVMLLAVLNNPC